MSPVETCQVSGLIDSDAAWSPAHCDPYLVVGDLTVASDVTLRIGAGTTIRFSGPWSLKVEGALTACGTEAGAVTFTSAQPEPAAGDWGSIHVQGPGSKASPDLDCAGHGHGTIIEHVLIEFAGGTGAGDEGALRIEASSPLIRHAVVRASRTDGIRVWGGSAATIQASTAAGNAMDGIAVYSAPATIVGNSVSGNGQRGVYVENEQGSLATTISGNTVAENGGSGIYLRYTSHNSGGTATVSGNTLSRNGGEGIRVDYENANDHCAASMSDNVVTASGSAGILATYASWNLANTLAVDGNTVSGNTGRGVVVSITANDQGNRENCASITDNEITGNYDGGVAVHLSSADVNSALISGNTVTYNTGGPMWGGVGIRVFEDSRVTITTNNLHHNATGGPPYMAMDLLNQNTQGQPDVAAENNYWGTTDPAIIESHVWHHEDDASLGVVDFTPFLLAPVAQPSPSGTPTPSPTAKHTPTVTATAMPSVAASTLHLPMILQQVPATPSATATPTATASRTPTSTPTATPALQNGGFESGDFSGWSHGGVLAHDVVESARRSGSYGAQLGGPDYACAGGAPANAAAYVYQRAVVPDTAEARLSFWYRVFSQDNRRFDYLRVAIRDKAGHELAELLRQGAPPPGGNCGHTWDSGWRLATLPLSLYGGQEVQVYFETVVSDPGDIKGWYNTWTWLDDVRVTQ